MQNTETTGDKWFREYVDVPAGDYVIGFEAIATSGRQEPGIAIDDVQLLAGECQTQGKSFCTFQMLQLSNRRVSERKFSNVLNYGESC